jgi:hypothetical protein
MNRVCELTAVGALPEAVAKRCDAGDELEAGMLAGPAGDWNRSSTGFALEGSRTHDLWRIMLFASRRSCCSRV